MPEGDAIFRRIADEAYKSNPAQEIDGFKLIASSPTLKFYVNGSDVIVGIRGTQDFTDAKADAAIVVGALENSQRFKTDLAFMQKIVSENPGKTFYGAGHSLGGAILDLFISKRLIKSGKSFNAALQLGKEETANQRIYNSGDALYKLSRPFLKQQLQVETRTPSALARLSGLYNLYEQHKLGAGKRRREPAEAAEEVGADARDVEPTAAEVAAAEARAERRERAGRAEEHIGTMEEQLNELSQEMFGKNADELDDEENELLDAAFQRERGYHEDEEDDEDEEGDGRTEVILKGKRTGRKGAKRMARAKRYMQKLKFPARIAQYKASLPFIKRRFNKSMAERRADPDYDVPSDGDETDYVFDDDGEEEPPPFEPGTYFRRGGGMVGRTLRV